MKNLFPEYYRPTEAQFAQLWDTCTFVLDTNVLIHLYRQSSDTRDDFLKALNHLAPRLWIPYQVALEYQRNRADVIVEQLGMYDGVTAIFRDAIATLKEKLEPYRDRHSFIDVDELISQVQAIADHHVAHRKQEHPDWINSDPIRDTLDDLLDGKVGEAYPPNKLDEIYKEGKERYDNDIPPGYGDKKKTSEAGKYGDLVIWKQVLEHAEETKQPIIFVTRDFKRDWWHEEHGRTIGPREELIREMKNKAGVEFYMYQLPSFMEYAQKYTKQNLEKAIDEAKRLLDEKVERAGYIFNPTLSSEAALRGMAASLGISPLNSVRPISESMMKVLGALPPEMLREIAGTKAFQQLAIRGFQDQVSSLISGLQFLGANQYTHLPLPQSSSDDEETGENIDDSDVGEQ